MCYLCLATHAEITGRVRVGGFGVNEFYGIYAVILLVWGCYNVPLLIKF